MERSLVLTSVLTGFVCWLVGIVLTRRRFGLHGIEGAIRRSILLFALIVPVVLFFATLPVREPIFAPGHDLGIGFLIGAIAALLSGVVLLQHMVTGTGERSGLRAAVTVASPFAMAVVSVAVLLNMHHDTLWIALTADAIGWLTTTMVLLIGVMRGPLGSVRGRSEPIALLAGATFAIGLCASVALGDLHGSARFLASSTQISFGIVALGLASSVPLFLIIGAVVAAPLSKRPRERAGVLTLKEAATLSYGRFAMALILTVGVGGMAHSISHRVLDMDVAGAEPRLPHLSELIAGTSHTSQITVYGLIVGLLIWWISSAQPIARPDDGTEDSLGEGAARWQRTGLSALVLLIGTMVAFQMMAGFGVGLLLLATFPATALALVRSLEPARQVVSPEGTDPNSTAKQAAIVVETALRLTLLSSMGAVLIVMRVFTSVYEDPHSSAYTDQYAAFGVLAGVVLPLFLSGFLLRRSVKMSPSAGALIFRLAVSALLLLAGPGLMLMLWGEKPIYTFLMSLAIVGAVSASIPGIAGVRSAGPGSESDGGGLETGALIQILFPTLFSLGLALAVTEWAHYLLDIEEWTRIQKERVVAQIVVALIFAVVASDYSGRLSAIGGRLFRGDRTAGKGGVR